MKLRTCSIEIHNNTSGPYALANPRVFIEKGFCGVPLPATVGPCSTGSAFFNKAAGMAGCAGVFTYDLVNPEDPGGRPDVLAAMFSVPYDRKLYSNWFAVGIFGGDAPCDGILYDIMYDGAPGNDFLRWKAGGSCTIKYSGDYVTAGAYMTDSGEAELRVVVNNTGFNV